MFWESEVQLLPEALCASAAEGRSSVRCMRVQPSSPLCCLPSLHSYLPFLSLELFPSALTFFLSPFPPHLSLPHIRRAFSHRTVACEGCECEWPGQLHHSFVGTSFSLVWESNAGTAVLCPCHLLLRKTFSSALEERCFCLILMLSSTVVSQISVLRAWVLLHNLTGECRLGVHTWLGHLNA